MQQPLSRGETPSPTLSSWRHPSLHGVAKTSGFQSPTLAEDAGTLADTSLYIDDFDLRMQQAEKTIRGLDTVVAQMRSEKGVSSKLMTDLPFVRHKSDRMKFSEPRVNQQEGQEPDAPWHEQSLKNPQKEIAREPVGRPSPKADKNEKLRHGEESGLSNKNNLMYPQAASDYRPGVGELTIHRSFPIMLEPREIRSGRLPGRGHLPDDVSRRLPALSGSNALDTSGAHQDDERQRLIPSKKTKSGGADETHRETQNANVSYLPPTNSEPPRLSWQPRSTTASAYSRREQSVPPPRLSARRECRDDLEQEVEERVHAEKERLRKEATDTLRTQWHAMDKEYFSKLLAVRNELEAEKEIRKEERIQFGETELMLQSQLRQAQKKYTEVTEQAEVDRRELNSALKRIQELENEVSELQKDRHQLQSVQLDLRADKHDLETRLDLQHGHQRRLACDFDTIQSQLTVLGSEKRKLEEDVGELRKIKGYLERNYKSTEQELQETRSQLASTSSMLVAAEERYTQLSKEFDLLQLRVADLEQSLKKKSEAEAEHLSTISELQTREHTLKMDIATATTRLTEADGRDRELLKLKREMEVLREQLNTAHQGLENRSREFKQLSATYEETSLGLRSCQNEILALKQENVKLKKELQDVKGAATRYPIIGDPAPLGDMAPKARSKPHRDSVGALLCDPVGQSSLQTLPAAGAMRRLPDSWDMKPPDGIPLYGGGGGHKAPNIAFNEDSGVVLPSPTTVMDSEPHFSGSALSGASTAYGLPAPFPGRGKGVGIGEAPRVAPSSALACHTKVAATPDTATLDKQLMLLQMEKNQVEADLRRCCGLSRSRTLKERSAKAALENRLCDITMQIQRVRQELRSMGAYRRRPGQYVC